MPSRRRPGQIRPKRRGRRAAVRERPRRFGSGKGGGTKAHRQAFLQAFPNLGHFSPSFSKQSFGMGCKGFIPKESLFQTFRRRPFGRRSLENNRPGDTAFGLGIDGVSPCTWFALNRISGPLERTIETASSPNNLSIIPLKWGR